MLISQQCRVYGNARAASGAVVPTRCRCQSSRLGTLVAVGRHIDASQPLLLLRQLLQLVLLLRVSPQLDEGTDEVDACHQDNEGHGAKEGSQAGLPSHPAAATHVNTLLLKERRVCLYLIYPYMKHYFLKVINVENSVELHSMV